MVTKTKSYPDVAIAPGEYLAEEIEARGITQKELARRMGRVMGLTDGQLKPVEPGA